LRNLTGQVAAPQFAKNCFPILEKLTISRATCPNHGEGSRDITSR
jgi:hypothetical protein